MTSPIMDVAHYYYHFVHLSPRIKYTILLQRNIDYDLICQEIHRLNHKLSLCIPLPNIHRVIMIKNKSEFLTRIKEYASSLSGEGVVVLSSHGYSGLPDHRQSESDGKNEYIRVHGQTVTDDELHDNLVQTIQHNVTLYAIVDTCSSGTMLDLPYSMSTAGVVEENKWSCPGSIYCWSACGDRQSDPDDLSSRYGYSGGLSSVILDHVDWSQSWEENTRRLFHCVTNMIVSSSRPLQTMKSLTTGAISTSSNDEVHFNRLQTTTDQLQTTTDQLQTTPDQLQSVTDYTPLMITIVITIGLVLWYKTHRLYN
jgi:hypothetical protein